MGVHLRAVWTRPCARRSLYSPRPGLAQATVCRLSPDGRGSRIGAGVRRPLGCHRPVRVTGARTSSAAAHWRRRAGCWLPPTAHLLRLALARLAPVFHEARHRFRRTGGVALAALAAGACGISGTVTGDKPRLPPSPVAVPARPRWPCVWKPFCARSTTRSREATPYDPMTWRRPRPSSCSRIWPRAGRPSGTRTRHPGRVGPVPVPHCGLPRHLPGRVAAFLEQIARYCGAEGRTLPGDTQVYTRCGRFSLTSWSKCSRSHPKP